MLHKHTRLHDEIAAPLRAPDGRVPDIQRRQMTTLGAENVPALSVNGDFDDCQRIVKQLYQMDAAAHYGYTAVNSINLVRIPLPVAYYVYSAQIVFEQTGQAANIVVPTGNFGNVFAGFIAKQLGVPIAKPLSCSTKTEHAGSWPLNAAEAVTFWNN